MSIESTARADESIEVEVVPETRTGNVLRNLVFTFERFISPSGRTSPMTKVVVVDRTDGRVLIDFKRDVDSTMSENLRASVQQDLATMTRAEFLEKYVPAR